ncbi:NAD-dependent epimerase/dehydratase family protein [Bdellovibrio bacteriovorus]
MVSAQEFYKGKRVFLTNPTSFLGAWTALALKFLGAEVFGYADQPATSPSLFDLANLGNEISMTYGDFRDLQTFRQVLNFAEADIVIHLGEMGLLSEAKSHPLDCFAKSVLGTTYLMELLRETATIRSVVVVSSDKVYGGQDNKPFTEGDAVSAGDILPTAKLCSELVALSYRHSFFNPEKYNKHKVAIGSARIESGIGGGDFSSGSLIAESVQAFTANKALELRNPQSMRPWIHVADQVSGILLLAQHLFEKGPKAQPTYNLGAKNFASVGEVVNSFARQWQAPLADIPESGSPSVHGRLESALAKNDFDWEPRLSLEDSLKEITAWYKAYQSGTSVSHQIRLTLVKVF